MQDGSDFRLKTGSAAVGAARCLSAVPTDIVGAARPGMQGCAEGAYEFGSTATVPPTQPLPAPRNLRLIALP